MSQRLWIRYEKFIYCHVGFAFPFFISIKLVRGGDSEISSTASLALKYRHMEIGECCACTEIGVVSFAEDSKIGSISRMY